MPAGRPSFAPRPSNFDLSSARPLLALDLQSPGIVQVAGRELRLAPLLYDLLATLAAQPGRVLTRQALYQRLWPEGGPEAQQLDAHRRRLASALRGAASDAGDTPGSRPAGPGDWIQVVRGVGFRLNLEPALVALRRG